MSLAYSEYKLRSSAHTEYKINSVPLILSISLTTLSFAHTEYTELN
jgi:hypothetical protein